jgi:hypothetical protein
VSDLTPEQTEDFLALWERAIELSDPNRRDAMEAERAGIWTAETQSRRLARSVLSDLQRNANVETDAGRELAEACAALRRTLDPAPSAKPAVRPVPRPRVASSAKAGAPNTPAWSAPLESLRRSPNGNADPFRRPTRKAKR